jgi:hypothetical protein
MYDKYKEIAMQALGIQELKPMDLSSNDTLG